jgi:translation initiation factor 2 alpha subunit (eIF-2alpha)
MNNVRYYGRPTPEVGEVVFAKVKKINEISIMCELVEYQGAEAMIPSTELSKRKHKSVKSLTSIGKLEPAIVMRNENGSIDLSRKRVDRDDIQKAENRYHTAKKLISVLHHYSQISGKPFQDLMERITYKWSDNGLKNTDATADEIEFIRQKFEIQSKVVLRCCFTATYYGHNGIETLKNIFSHSAYPVKYVSAPLYSIELECMDATEGCTKLMCEIQKIKEMLEEKGGSFEIKSMPQIVNKNTEDDEEDGMEDVEDVEDEEDLADDEDTMGQCRWILV